MLQYKLETNLGICFGARTFRVRYLKGKYSCIELNKLTTLRANDFGQSKNKLLNEDS